MGAGGVGDKGPDQAVASLRRLLAQANDDERFRARALQRVVQGQVFAATWPDSNESVRTLTNTEGEQAMPLFSDADTLHAAATRFGWLAADGSCCSRGLSARDALSGAIAQGVQFVIVDIGTRHAAEFSRE